MKLVELGEQAKVKLSIYIDDRNFEFDTVISMFHRKSALIVPIRKDNRLLNVQGDNVRVDVLLMRENDKPLIWENTNMECVRFRGQIYYSVDANMEGKEYNRRGDYRLYIGEEIHARIGHNGPERIVLLKDISNSGFAFIYTEDLPNSDGAFVYMTYPARIEDQYKELALFGKVVRKMPLEDGRMLYGCVLVKKNELVGRFIMQKQMEQLAKKKERLI